MINSTALPNVTFSNAPNESPSLRATVSVAKLSSPASGMMATAFVAKMAAGGMPGIWAMAIPMGTKTSRRLSLVWNKTVLKALMNLEARLFCPFSSPVSPRIDPDPGALGDVVDGERMTPSPGMGFVGTVVSSPSLRMLECEWRAAWLILAGVTVGEVPATSMGRGLLTGSRSLDRDIEWVPPCVLAHERIWSEKLEPCEVSFIEWMDVDSGSLKRWAQTLLEGRGMSAVGEYVRLEY